MKGTQMKINSKTAGFLFVILLATGCASDTKSARTVEGQQKPAVAQPPLTQTTPAQNMKNGTRQLSSLSVSKEDKWLKENELLYSKLRSYKEGVTTQGHFVSDGWNFKDPYFGKIGVVGVFKNIGKAMVVMGIVPIDQSKDSGFRDALLYVFEDKWEESLEDVLRIEKVSQEPANIALVVCLIELSDGLVKKVTFCEPVSWSEVQPKYNMR
jgi:hypothetical protein